MIAALVLPEAGPLTGRPVDLLVLIALLAVVPAALVMLTSFLKVLTH